MRPSIRRLVLLAILAPAAAIAATAPSADVPDTPSRASLSAAMANARPGIQICRERHRSGARLHVKVRFAPSGAVTDVVIDPPSGQSTFDACVSSVLLQMHVPPSHAGARISYAAT